MDFPNFAICDRTVRPRSRFLPLFEMTEGKPGSPIKDVGDDGSGKDVRDDGNGSDVGDDGVGMMFGMTGVAH